MCDGVPETRSEAQSVMGTTGIRPPHAVLPEDTAETPVRNAQGSHLKNSAAAGRQGGSMEPVRHRFAAQPLTAKVHHGEDSVPRQEQGGGSAEKAGREDMISPGPDAFARPDSTPFIPDAARHVVPPRTVGRKIAPPPQIRVTIGRIEVKAVHDTAPVQHTKPAGPRQLSLEEYLRKRRRGNE